jgi:hypothetical protein
VGMSEIDEKEINGGGEMMRVISHL